MVPAVRELYDFAASVLDGLDQPCFPAQHVLSILCSQLDAPGAVLQRTAWRTGETDIVATGYSDHDVPLLIAATQAMRHQHPLMVANAAGDLTPATAQTAAGGWLAWQHSPARGFLADLRGWDQMASLALRGGPEEVCALAFSRSGRDFVERELSLLQTVQPLLQAVDRHVVRMDRWLARTTTRQPLPAVRAAGLTARELGVLVLLAEGLTAAAIARRLGCSLHTVHKHTGNIYRKLEARDRLTEVLEAQRRGLLESEGVAAQ